MNVPCPCGWVALQEEKLAEAEEDGEEQVAFSPTLVHAEAQSLLPSTSFVYFLYLFGIHCTIRTSLLPRPDTPLPPTFSIAPSYIHVTNILLMGNESDFT